MILQLSIFSIISKLPYQSTIKLNKKVPHSISGQEANAFPLTAKGYFTFRLKETSRKKPDSFLALLFPWKLFRVP